MSSEKMSTMPKGNAADCNKVELQPLYGRSFRNQAQLCEVSQFQQIRWIFE